MLGEAIRFQGRTGCQNQTRVNAFLDIALQEFSKEYPLSYADYSTLFVEIK